MESLTRRFKRFVFSPYIELLKSQYRIHSKFSHAKRIWEQELNGDILIKGPYLEKSKTYQQGTPLNDLPLHQKTKQTIRERLKGRNLYKHQTDALKLLLKGENTIIATGTSSGKTLCYQVPILDDMLLNPGPGLRAIIIYPLNALVNDQLIEWEEILHEHKTITFARFSGQTPASQVDYEERIKGALREDFAEQSLTQQQLQRKVSEGLRERLIKDATRIPNRLNHRDTIRKTPPNILITNFSMLEYLLSRPIDSPLFMNARLKYLVLDEAHSYRGVQATEISFLVHRLKDRLGIEKLTCIATSATLGKKDDAESVAKVRRFARNLFGEEFNEENPIYGEEDEPSLLQPTVRPTPSQYIEAASALRKGAHSEAVRHLGSDMGSAGIASILEHDENLFILRKDILRKPQLLREAAGKIWPKEKSSFEGLEALLEVVAAAKSDKSSEDMLPTRLHYFIKAQDGFYVCLHLKCPGRIEGKSAFFVSRGIVDGTTIGECPKCDSVRIQSKLIEVVSCRKCGYLFCAIQDLGPSRGTYRENGDGVKPYFDSFSTELGWAADSFWSYFSVDDDLPYPSQATDEEDSSLILAPAILQLCIQCGKKSDKGVGDNCECEKPHLRKIMLFHRQCPFSGKSDDRRNLFVGKKKALSGCPNCGARNASGLEPVRRFQESDDEIGLHMAIPLAHFQVSPMEKSRKESRKLLCFTDNRQRAAAFPPLLEEETFTHDFGRKIVQSLQNEPGPWDFVRLGERLADMAKPESDKYDPNFFMPISRFPDETIDAKEKDNLWIAETFSYFGVPDSARESAEDHGLVAVEFKLETIEREKFHNLLTRYGIQLHESVSVLQTLLKFIRQAKAFTLPPHRVSPDAPAFGRIGVEISYVFRKPEGSQNCRAWLPQKRKDGGYRDNSVTDYLKRLFGLPSQEIEELATAIWDFLKNYILVDRKKKWQLDHQRLYVVKPSSRFVCSRCKHVTCFSAKSCCPRKGCEGHLEAKQFRVEDENIIGKWVAGSEEVPFTSLKSEEHSAQIEKNLAKRIEDKFRESGITRESGIDVLSSTTTFEMGINIGDLQKILLRNAPPSIASYIQRVGRAGRGNDRNSVIVTMCRRTKYDADVWDDPPRLMAGGMNPPTIFKENKVIAQRHFNAVLFSQFLRQKIVNERVFKEIKQGIDLAAFLPLQSRKNLPLKWFRMHPQDVYLDFIDWLDSKKEKSFFRTDAGLGICKAVNGFSRGVESALKLYKKIIGTIDSELLTLCMEREKAFKKVGGKAADDIEQGIKNMFRSNVIEVLAKRGFLPRYAFPLDVVTLETGKTRWSGDSDVEIARDRGIAIAEFAPSAQVVAHKKVFESAGLYVLGTADKPERRWFSKCPDCERIHIGLTLNDLLGSCQSCGRKLTQQHSKPFVEPKSFSVRVNNRGEGATRFRRSTLIRQRQPITHFIDKIDDVSMKEIGFFKVSLKENGTLFRYNMGPNGDGFILCPDCGSSWPAFGNKSEKSHKQLRTFSGSSTCRSKQIWPRPIAYGHRFDSFCLIIQPLQSPPSIHSLAFALQRGLCDLLEILTNDIGVSWRWEGNKKEGGRPEIILYDLAPGGAGFVADGFENWKRVVDKSLELTKNCKCQTACYECLKTFGNQAYHEHLNRKTVVDFLTDY